MTSTSTTETKHEKSRNGNRNLLPDLLGAGRLVGLGEIRGIERRTMTLHSSDTDTTRETVVVDIKLELGGEGATITQAKASVWGPREKAPEDVKIAFGQLEKAFPKGTRVLFAATGLKFSSGLAELKLQPDAIWPESLAT